MDDNRAESKQDCSFDVGEKKALPPIPGTPPNQGKGSHREKVEQNTQTEMNEPNLVATSNNITERIRNHRGNRKDGPNLLTGRISPRKKRTGNRVEPNKKKHQCGLYDAPPPKPERRQLTGFFHPGLASIQGNINTLQHHSVNRLPQSARKFMTKETKYKVDTVHGHRVPVTQDLDFCPNRAQKQKWKRRLSPIKRKVVQCERDAPVKEEHQQLSNEGGENQSENNDKTVDRSMLSGEPDQIKVISVVTPLEDPQIECRLEDEETAMPSNQVPDMKAYRQDGDQCDKSSTTHPGPINSNTEYAESGNSISYPKRPALIEDAIRELVNSMVSRISPELDNSADQNSSPLSDTSSSEYKQLISIGIQTNLMDLECQDRTKISLLNDESCCAECVTERSSEDVERSNSQEVSGSCSSQTEEHQLRYVESYSASDKPDSDNNDDHIHNREEYTVHLSVSKGTMTPTILGWQALEDSLGQENPVSNRPITTPSVEGQSSLTAQHILEVPGLGRMNMPFQHQQIVQPEISDMDVVTESVSNSDEQLQRILIEDSGGDYTPAARTESRVSIFTLGHGDQRMAISSSLSNIPSPQLGSVVGDEQENESRLIESRTDADPAEERSHESKPSSRERLERDSVQELIDNLIAERLNGVAETQMNDSVTAEKGGSPLTDPIQLFTLRSNELSDHQPEIFRRNDHSNESETDNSLIQETILQNPKPMTLKLQPQLEIRINC
nr:uncharacterized protein LOC129253601 [Lytechinus pictus]